jgi:epothilone polyketide synthase A
MRAADSRRGFLLTLDSPGSVEGMTLRATRRRPPGRGEVEIEVAAAGLNFLDVLLVLGLIPASLHPAGAPPVPLGLECAGRVVALGEDVAGLEVGQDVVALGPGALASHLTTSALLVAPQPKRISHEQAATIVGAHLTAYQALAKAARLARGERVLIHAAAGGVGLAAIQWAQHIGAQIHATAGSSQKREYLQSLGIHHLSDSRSDRFVSDVMAQTAGEGVDVVLNSLSGELLEKSFGLLRDFGRFIEIGKRDCIENTRLGMRPFLKNLTFSLVDLMGMARHRPEQISALLREIAEHIDRGNLNPLPFRCFAVCQAEEAFRFMASGQHIGKLVLSMRDPAAQVLLSAADPPAAVSETAGEGRPAGMVRISSCEHVLAELTERGIEIWAEGNALRYRAAKAALTPELRISLRFYKEELLDALARRSG